VFNVYTTVKQQLPSIENVDTFISAQQMAVTQLAIAFCDQAVEDDTLRQAWWPDFDVDASVPLAFTTENRPNLITPIIERLMPQAPATQPEVSELSNELNNLVTRLAACNENCDAQRTKTITKASCAAVLASAMTLIQ
jgi:hypothetical protein